MSPTSRSGPADRRRLVGEALEELDQVRMAPVAVARQPHHLPGRAVDRQRHAAGETAAGVVADRARRQRRGLRPCGRTGPWPASSDRPACSSGGSGFGSSVPRSCAAASPQPAISRATVRGPEGKPSGIGTCPIFTQAGRGPATRFAALQTRKHSAVYARHSSEAGLYKPRSLAKIFLGCGAIRLDSENGNASIDSGAAAWRALASPAALHAA